LFYFFYYYTFNLDFKKADIAFDQYVKSLNQPDTQYYAIRQSCPPEFEKELQETLNTVDAQKNSRYSLKFIFDEEIPAFKLLFTERIKYMEDALRRENLDFGCSDKHVHIMKGEEVVNGDQESFIDWLIRVRSIMNFYAYDEAENFITESTITNVDIQQIKKYAKQINQRYGFSVKCSVTQNEETNEPGFSITGFTGEVCYILLPFVPDHVAQSNNYNQNYHELSCYYSTVNCLSILYFDGQIGNPNKNSGNPNKKFN
jgi:hypothetical protein